MPFQTHPENREFTGGVCGGGGLCWGWEAKGSDVPYALAPTSD